MFGEYPIVVDGTETGTLRVLADGIMTAFDARCKDPGTLLRLSVYGEKEAYLGVMAPDGSGDVHLHRRLSRAALSAFPETIRFAGPAGQEQSAQGSETKTAEERSGAEKAAGDESLPCPEKGDTDAVRWRQGAGGALVGTRADKRYLAVPIKAGVEPAGGDFERQRIANAEYAVFEIK